MYKTKERGFTLVELIVVIVVLGILAAIGIPRYNNYVNDSRLAHIKADMKTISGLIEVVAMEDDGVFRDGSFDDLSELEKAITEGRAYKEGNLLLQDDIGGEFHVIKELFIKSNARSKLKGTFLVDENDEIYYIADQKLKGNSNPQDVGDTGNSDEWIVADIEEGVISDFLVTLSKRGKNKYTIVSNFNNDTERLFVEKEGFSDILFTDGWDEVEIGTFMNNVSLDEKPTLYHKDLYSIGNIVYYAGKELQGHSVVVVSEYLTYVKDDDGNVYELESEYEYDSINDQEDLVYKAKHIIENINDDTKAIIQNIGKVKGIYYEYLNERVTNGIFADGNIYIFQNYPSNSLKLTKVINNTGEDIIGLIGKNYVKLKSGKYMHIVDNELVELDNIDADLIEDNKTFEEKIKDINDGNIVFKDCFGEEIHIVEALPENIESNQVRVVKEERDGSVVLVVMLNGKLFRNGYLCIPDK